MRASRPQQEQQDGRHSLGRRGLQVQVGVGVSAGPEGAGRWLHGYGWAVLVAC